MVRSTVLVLTALLFAGMAAAQSNKDVQPATTAGAGGPQASSSLPAGTAIRATLNTTIDSKKVKPGDKVTAEATAAIKVDNNVVLPSGTRLIGHVTQASARSKGDAFSAVGITFDKAVPKHKEEIPLNVSIQALAAAPQSPQTDAAAMDAPSPNMGYGAGSPAGGRPGAPGTMTPQPNMNPGNVTNTVGNTDTNNAIAGKGATGGLDSTGQLAPDSRGVFGLQGIGLAAGTVGTEPATVITSTEKEVRLDSGTRLLLISQDQVQAAK